MLPGDGAGRGVLAEELLVGHLCVVELLRVVDGYIKELTVRRVQLVIVLTEANIEVAHPAELTVDIPLLCQFRVLGHASAFHLVLFIGVKLSLHWKDHLLPIGEVFVEVLLWKPIDSVKTSKRLLIRFVL